MPAFPAKAEITGPYPTPSSGTARTGFAKLWDALTGLLGLTGDAADARDALGIGSTISYRNQIINGRFKINERAVSGTVVLAAGQYGHDRWKAGSGGCTYTFATSGGITTVTITSGSLVQVIEDQNVISNTYTVSRVGTSQARVVGGTYAPTPFQITGVTPGAALSVEFGTGTLTSVQVEAGSVATPFEFRPRPLELFLCQAYGQAYPIGSLDHIGNNAVSGQNNSYTVPNMVPKRGTPTVTATWTGVNAGAIALSVANARNVVLNVPNTAAGQWRITNTSIAFIDAEL